MSEITIDAIPGVSPAEASALAVLGLATSADLLNTNRAELVRQMPGLTLAKVIEWQAFSELAEIGEIAPAAAAALRAAGADGVSEFASWTLTRARAALPQESDEQIVAWQKDALRLSLLGVINGTICLANGNPVEAAEVTIDGRTVSTNVHGRFRMAYLALDRSFTVTVHHPNYGHKRTTGVRASRTAALVGVRFTLPGRPQVAKALSELVGDALPPVGSAPIATKAITGAPDPLDILLVVDRYPNGDARVASRFLDFADGRFVRRTYRIPVADLPPGLRDGDDLKRTATGWMRTRIPACKIAREVRVRAVRRMAKQGTLTPAKMDRIMKAMFRASSNS